MECSCECSKHPHWKCKKRKERSNEKDDDDKEDTGKGSKALKSFYGVSHYSSDFQNRLNSHQTFLVRNHTKLSSKKKQRCVDLGPLTELISYQQPNSSDMEIIQLDNDYTLLSNFSKTGNIHSFILDTGAPHTRVSF